MLFGNTHHTPPKSSVFTCKHFLFSHMLRSNQQVNLKKKKKTIHFWKGKVKTRNETCWKVLYFQMPSHAYLFTKVPFNFSLYHQSGVFWLNIAKSGIYLRYSHCSKLFRELRKDSEFRQQYCWNSTKVWERKRKSGREKILSFGNGITEIPTAQTNREINCGNAIAEVGKKNLWQCHCWKWEEK